MGKFKVGDIVVGNKSADENYAITRFGYKGLVTKLYTENDDEFIDFGDTIQLDSTYDVDERFFDLIAE